MFEMFYAEQEPIDSIPKVRFMIESTIVKIYSKGLLIVTYQLQSLISY